MSEQNRCRSCNNAELLRIHQVGVINSLKTGGASEPEVLFDIIVCPICGDARADPETIKIKNNQGIYTIFKLSSTNEEGKAK